MDVLVCDYPVYVFTKKKQYNNWKLVRAIKYLWPTRKVKFEQINASATSSGFVGSEVTTYVSLSLAWS